MINPGTYEFTISKCPHRFWKIAYIMNERDKKTITYHCRGCGKFSEGSMPKGAVLTESWQP